MPAVEAGEIIVLLVGNSVAVECTMVGVFQLDIGEALVSLHETMADHLDLRLMRNGLKVGMQNAPFRIKGLSVAVLRGGRVESTGKLVLCFRREVVLVFHHHHEVLVQRSANDAEVVI